MTVDEFITEWKKSGGNERANTQMFINDPCELLGLQRPRATRSDMAANDYVFERHDQDGDRRTGIEPLDRCDIEMQTAFSKPVSLPVPDEVSPATVSIGGQI